MKFTSRLKAAIFCFTMISAATFAQAPAQEKIEVSDTELGQVAKAFMGIQQVNAQAQQEMVKTVEESGFELERFNELYEASVATDKNVEASSEEKEKFGVVMNQIQNKQASFQKQMEDAIVKEGITIERYQQVAVVLQSDKDLQQRLQAILTAGQQ
ncbi:DUF4168 domain-containing protein [Galbibacter sp.]|jgi:hypothetical protein|uniref:DUF4168 domain-containing protein n=1 Tax=Galbibacter sp. TaxID=2918471 RepID=UPI003A90675D